MQYFLFMPQASHGSAQLLPQLRLVVTAYIAQFAVFQVVPHALYRVQIGCVAWQPFQPQTFCTHLPHEVFDDLPAMNRRPIPQHPQRPRHMPQQVAQEVDDPGPVECTRAHLLQQLAVLGQAPDYRQMVARQRHGQDRRLPARGSVLLDLTGAVASELRLPLGPYRRKWCFAGCITTPKRTSATRR